MASPRHDPNVHAGQGDSSQEHSTESSAPASRGGGGGGGGGGSRTPKEKHRVRFNPGGESLDTTNRKSAFELIGDSGAPSVGLGNGKDYRSRSRTGTDHLRNPPGPSVTSSNTKPSETSASAPARPAGPIRTLSPTAAASSTAEADDLSSKTTAAAGKGKSIPQLPESPLRREEQMPKYDETHLRDTGDCTEEGTDDTTDDGTDDDAAGKMFSQKSAQERAQRLSRMVGTQSAPTSRHASPIRKPGGGLPGAQSPPPSPPMDSSHSMPIDLSDIPLEKLASRRTKYGIEDESDDEEIIDEKSGKKRKGSKTPPKGFSKALRGIKRQQQSWVKRLQGVRDDPIPPLRSGTSTPVYERDPHDYVPRPKKYRDGYLSSLMKLYEEQGAASAFINLPRGNDAIDQARHGGAAQSLLNSTNTTPAATPVGSPNSPGSITSPTPSNGSPNASGTTTPRAKHQKWYYKDHANRSTGSIADLVGSSTILAQPGIQGAKQQAAFIRPKPKHRPHSSQAVDAVFGKKKKLPRAKASLHIQVHIAETMQRHSYILRMCKALMAYGAPTHRLEEYMRMSARVLEIDGQFLYIPGCMIVSFDDPGSHTTEVKIVRTVQVVNLGKLRDTHQIYKEVVHDTIGVEEAMQRLDKIIAAPNKYSPWFLVFIYGLASMCVGPFAFGARPIDLPIAFLLGCLLGFMQLILAPRSDLYSNIFEISAAVLTSFLARAFGSIHDGNLFCFSALAQSSIALILPGYTVLCGSLELQSRNMVAGSVRMVYAIIYSLFLGFGITVGTSFYGWADRSATSATTCKTSWPFWWKVIFVAPFTLCLIIINQGKAKQMPVMIGIAMVGYIVNHFSAIRFSTNAQIANTLGALAIGVLGNLYSRLRHGLAAAALLPAIFVQVPSGLAASGSLISGVSSADQITNTTLNGTYANATTDTNSMSSSGQGLAGGSSMNTAVLNVGYSMIQVAIGITVGLFLSALVVYPFGKRRSGLFSF